MRSIPSQGYFLEYPMRESISKKKSFQHQLCGDDVIPGAISPNSGRPLLQLMRLDTSDPRLQLSCSQTPFIYLLFSWTCDISQGRFVYKHQSNGIEILTYLAGRTYNDFPYNAYPNSFPAFPVALVSIADETQSLIRRINEGYVADEFRNSNRYFELSTPRHQIGGEPFYLGGRPRVDHCPLCGEEMYFIAAIGNHNGADDKGFCGNDFVQVTYQICTGCLVLSADQKAD